MKLRTLASTVQSESLQTLIGEAGWRGIRAVRRRIFQFAGQDGLCPVRFHPIGYFQSQRQPVSDRSFADIVAYADSILQGSYPLLGYGSPRLGVTVSAVLPYSRSLMNRCPCVDIATRSHPRVVTHFTISSAGSP